LMINTNDHIETIAMQYMLSMSSEHTNNVMIQLCLCRVE
jgi:hypothetical protein